LRSSEYFPKRSLILFSPKDLKKIKRILNESGSEGVDLEIKWDYYND